MNKIDDRLDKLDSEVECQKMNPAIKEINLDLDGSNNRAIHSYLAKLDDLRVEVEGAFL